MNAHGIDHINVGFPRDRLDEVIEFYVDTLGFEAPFEDPYAAVADDPGLFGLELGDGDRLFVNPTDELDSPGVDFRHVAVKFRESPATVKARLDDEGIEINSTAERSRETIGDYTSYYVSDPFGYTVECMAIGK